MKIEMNDYTKSILEEFPESPCPRKVNNLSSDSIFNEGPNRPLDRKLSDNFHKNVAKLLFISKPALLDILPTVAVLCTRVKRLLANDWNKLKHIISYLHCHPKETLKISANNGTKSIKWWIEESFAVHTDFRSHTGAMMKFGSSDPNSQAELHNESGAVTSFSCKQKPNTRSSTEYELVAVDDVI